MRASIIAFLFLSSGTLGAQVIGHWETRAPLPVRRSNMAAASVMVADTPWVYVFMGLDSTKLCGHNTLTAYRYNTLTDTWFAAPDVPDANGRIAASATGWRGRIYLVGGYEVTPGCGESTSPRLDIFDPATGLWTQGDSVPIPTDDHVQLLWRDSLIVCISGWSNTTNTKAVQLYNPATDSWTAATSLTGPGLFGHAGAILGDTLYYLDGVRVGGSGFVLVNGVYQGIMDPSDATTITWNYLGTHPGNKVYRGAGFAVGNRIVFTGGTNNAYNINGIGYNGVPSVETGRTFGFHPNSGIWEEYASNPDSVMDVRQVAQVGNTFHVVGGMSAGQTVTNKHSVFVVDTVITARAAAYTQPQPWAYPQPMTESVNIHLLGPGQWEFVLIDAKGSELCHWSMTVQSETVTLNLPEDLPPGIYVLKGEENHGRHFVLRVISQ